MKTNIAILPLLATLSGCSLVRDLVGRALPPAEPAAKVVPGSLLEGDAARFQDSLKANLEWLESHGPKGFPASRIAFVPDSLDTARGIALELEIRDRTRRNSHRRTAEEIALEEARSILALHPWRAEAIQAKWSGTLRAKVLYRSRDFINSSSRYEDDTIVVRYQDSAVTWKGRTLRP